MPLQLLHACMCMAVVLSHFAESEGFVTNTKLFMRQKICPRQAVNRTNCTQIILSGYKGRCSTICSRDPNCMSFFVETSRLQCYVCADVAKYDCSNVEYVQGDAFQIYCLNGGLLNASGMCQCSMGYIGEVCQTRMTDCQDWKKAGYGDGIYWIFPVLATVPFLVRCQMTDGRTYFLSRFSNATDFYRNWTEYRWVLFVNRNGFGNLQSDHWLGLQNIWALTNSRTYTMYAELTLRNGSGFQQLYHGFAVASEAQYFALSFDTTESNILRPLGDSLTYVKGANFSTYDMDLDTKNGSCAEQYHSGWWFKNCGPCNPTGVLVQPVNMQRSIQAEVFWYYNLTTIVPHTVEMWLQTP